MIASVVLIGFLLQSCGGFSSLPLANSAHKDVSIQSIQAIDYKPLLEQTLLAEGGHAVTFYEYQGDLQASIEPYNQKYKVYNEVPVVIEKGTDVRSLAHLPKEVQKARIQFKHDKQGKVIAIHNPWGMGGGKSEDEDVEKEPTYKEKFGNIKRKRAQIQQPNEKEQRYALSNNQQKKNKRGDYAPNKRPRLISPQPVAIPKEPINNNKTSFTTKEGAITFI